MYQSWIINPPLLDWLGSRFHSPNHPFTHTHAWNSSRAALCPIACFGSRQETVPSLQTVSALCMTVIGKSVCLIWASATSSAELSSRCGSFALNVRSAPLRSGPCSTSCYTSERLGRCFVPLRRSTPSEGSHRCSRLRPSPPPGSEFHQVLQPGPHHVDELKQETFLCFQKRFFKWCPLQTLEFGLSDLTFPHISDGFTPQNSWREIADDSQLDHTYLIEYAASCSARDCASPPVCIPGQGEADYCTLGKKKNPKTKEIKVFFVVT